MPETATDAAPVSQETPAAPPAVEQAPPTQRSTGGNGNAAPPRGINLDDAQSMLRQAYGRQREMQEGATGGAEVNHVQQGEPPAVEAGTRGTAPMGPEGPVVQLRERDPATGRFLPRDQVQVSNTAGAVDTPERGAVQETPTPAPPRQATPRPPAPAKAPPAEPGAPPEASPSPATPDESPTPPAPQATAQEFASERWQRAFRAQPGLKRVVARLRSDPNLSPVQLAEQLSEKLQEGIVAADQDDWRVEQLRQLRREDPPAYARQMELEEQEAGATRDLSVRISSMIAEAFEVDADDPDYLAAGPEEGEDEVTGLAKFVDFMARKSPKLTGVRETVLQEQAAKHAQAIAALKAQHKQDLEAAEERGRASGRSPWGRNGNGAPAPRSNGTGVVPIGEQTGTTVPTRAPDVSTVRGLIQRGYEARERANQ